MNIFRSLENLAQEKAQDAVDAYKRGDAGAGREFERELREVQDALRTWKPQT